MNRVGIVWELIVMRNDNVIVDIESNLEDYIDLNCKNLDNGKMMRITLLHVSINFQERLTLWQQILFISSHNRLPWICVGDFNEILYHWGKVEKREADY